jgi:hypothetical protein
MCPIQELLEPACEDMAVSDARFDKLANRVEDLAQQLIKVRERLSRIEGANSNRPTLQTILYFGGGAVALCLLTYLAWLGVETYNHNGQLAQIQTKVSTIEKNSQGLSEGIEAFEKRTTDQLESINAELRVLRSVKSPAKVLNEIKDLKAGALAKNLPALRRVAELPVGQVKPSIPELREVTYNLRSVDESSEEYWPTVLQFIQFASSAMAPAQDVPPPGFINIRISQSHCSPSIAGHCIVASHRAILLDGGSMPNSMFDHCRVIFTQNAVDLRGSVFNECVFEMPVSSAPTPYLKNVTKVLLASNLSNVSFPKS